MQFLLHSFHFSARVHLAEEGLIVGIEVVVVAVISAPELRSLDDE